jgi:hypothetical protein
MVNGDGEGEWQTNVTYYGENNFKYNIYTVILSSFRLHCLHHSHSTTVHEFTTIHYL